MEDVRDLTNVLDDLNLAGDPELTRVNEEIRRGLLFQAEDLRSSPTLRQMAGDRAGELLNSIPWS